MLWSTGFVVARYGTRDSGPLTFLCVRLATAGLLLWIFAALTSAPKITTSNLSISVVVGILMHAVYLGGVFVAIDNGLPSGLSALIAGLHPVATCIAARIFLKERLSAKQIAGVFLGLTGVCAVVLEKLEDSNGGVTKVAMIAMGFSVFGLTLGTLLQRKFSKQIPLLRGTAVQFLSSGVVLAIGASYSENWQIKFTAQTMLALSWGVLVLSLGAVLIMFVLLARHPAARVTSLFFLTPALSTIEGAILFGERLGALALVGLIIAIFGVRMTMQPTTATPDASTA